MKKLLLICSSNNAKIVLFSKLSNFYFDLRLPHSRPTGKTGERKPNPRGSLECANSQGSPGGGGQAWNSYITPETLMDSANACLEDFLFFCKDPTPKIRILLKIDGAVPFCFVSHTKICSDGAARSLTCINK